MLARKDFHRVHLFAMRSLAVMYHLMHGEYKPLRFSFSSYMNLITIVFVLLHSNGDGRCISKYPADAVGVANW